MLVERHVRAFLHLGRSLTPPNADAPPAVVSELQSRGERHEPPPRKRRTWRKAGGKIKPQVSDCDSCIPPGSTYLPARLRSKQETVAMRAFIFPGQGSQAVGMGKALAEASRDGARRVRGGRRRARPEAERADGRGAAGRADPHRQRPAGDHGQCDRDAARVRASTSPTRRISSPATALANIARCAPPAPSTSPPPRACSSCAARRCRRRCRSARARWRPCSAPTSSWRRRSPTRRREGEVCTVANDNDPEPGGHLRPPRRGRARARHRQGEGRQARACCCRSRRRSTAR